MSFQIKSWRIRGKLVSLPSCDFRHIHDEICQGDMATIELPPPPMPKVGDEVLLKVKIKSQWSDTHEYQADNCFNFPPEWVVAILPKEEECKCRRHGGFLRPTIIVTEHCPLHNPNPKKSEEELRDWCSHLVWDKDENTWCYKGLGLVNQLWTHCCLCGTPRPDSGEKPKEWVKLPTFWSETVSRPDKLFDVLRVLSEAIAQLQERIEREK